MHVFNAIDAVGFDLNCFLNGIHAPEYYFMILIWIFHIFLVRSCAVGIGLPVYSTFKAIENRDSSEQHKWLVYWAGCLKFLFWSFHSTALVNAMSFLWWRLKFLFFFCIRNSSINMLLIFFYFVLFFNICRICSKSMDISFCHIWTHTLDFSFLKLHKSLIKMLKFQYVFAVKTLDLDNNWLLLMN